MCRYHMEVAHSYCYKLLMVFGFIIHCKESYISCVNTVATATSSYPDGGYRNHMGVAYSYCYKLLVIHEAPKFLHPGYFHGPLANTMVTAISNVLSIPVIIFLSALHHPHFAQIVCSQFTTLCCFESAW